MESAVEETDADPTDDEGPAGLPPGPAPPAGTKPRQIADKSAKGKQFAEFEVSVTRQTHFLAAPRRGGPKFEQIMARAARNMHTLEYYEREAAVVGKSREELSKPLALKGKAKTSNLRVVYCCDPFYAQPDCVEVYDPDFGEATLKRIQKESTNPGVHPNQWWKMGGPARRLPNTPQKERASTDWKIRALTRTYSSS